MVSRFFRNSPIRLNIEIRDFSNDDLGPNPVCDNFPVCGQHFKGSCAHGSKSNDPNINLLHTILAKKTSLTLTGS